MSSFLRAIGIGRQRDETFGMIDSRTASSIQQYFQELSKASVAKQLAVGGVAGWCSGFLFCKVGKPAALALGSSLLILQIATHKGYITVNWTKLNRQLREKKEEISRSDASRIMNTIRIFIEDNLFLAGGYASGFLIGLATS